MAVFDDERDRLFGLAYRMMGSVGDAEDIVQEAWISWDASDRETIQNPAGFLTTVVTRRSLDRLRSAQHRREEYPGPWLPEPMIEELDPADSVVQAESLTLAFLGVLERLGPMERAVFLLHDVFDFSFGEVAEATGQTESACRKMASRARTRVHEAKPRYELPGASTEELMGNLVGAVQAGDIETLLQLLDTNIEIHTDGGRKVHAAPRPILGPHRAARFLVGVAAHQRGASVELRAVNGEPGVIVSEENQIVTVMSFTFAEGKLTAMRAIRNPDKLAYVARQLAEGQSGSVDA
ncbi:MAG: RNA polymerase sigma factor SigJ [Acidimicrobiales bacterium]